MSDNTLFFTIPYAGGSAVSLSNITHKLDLEKLEIHRLELPGRGMRQDENLLLNFEDMIEDLFQKVENTIRSVGQPIILWGHSMGAVLALIISYKLTLNKYKVCGLIVSGMKAPHGNSESGKKLSNLSVRDFKKLINKLIPPKYRENIDTPIYRSFLEKQESILQADVEALEYFKPENWLNIKIDAPIFVLKAENDELMPNIKSYDDWRLSTNNYVQYYIMEGGHFFNIEYPVQTVKVIKKIISKILEKSY